MLIPLKNKCLIEPVSKYGQTAGGLYTTGTTKEIPTKGKVIASACPDVNPDDIVYLRKYFWKDFTYKGQKHLCVKYDDITAIERAGELFATGDKVIVEMEYEEKRGLIYVPPRYKQMRANFVGIVIAVGPEVKLELNKGDKVIILRMEDAHHEGIEIDKGNLWCIKEKWVMGVRK